MYSHHLQPYRIHKQNIVASHCLTDVDTDMDNHCTNHIGHQHIPTSSSELNGEFEEFTISIRW